MNHKFEKDFLASKKAERKMSWSSTIRTLATKLECAFTQINWGRRLLI